MSALRRLALLAALAAAAASAEDPVAEVIQLLGTMKTDIVDEGQTEASTYETFACNCKDKTDEKSTAILESKDKIDELAASIAEDTEIQRGMEKEVQDNQKKQEKLAEELKATVSRCQTEMAEFEADSADIAKAVDSLEKAIEALENSKPSAASMVSVKKAVKENLAVADALGLLRKPKQQALRAFLQEGRDPLDAHYKFHSDTIMDLLTDLETDFKKRKGDVKKDWDEARASCGKLRESQAGEMKATMQAISDLQEEIASVEEGISGNRESLVQEESTLKDDEQYLKDLTTQCESAAVQWDQRSKLRDNEIKAITKALEVLEGEVKKISDDLASEDTFVQKHSRPVKVAPHAVTKRPALFLQEREAVVSSRNLLKTNSAARRLDRVQALLRSEGSRLGSGLLGDLADKVAADPFGKARTLVQDLIERLLKEAAEAATLKGFCDEKIETAKQVRDYKNIEVEKASAELEALESKKEGLEQDLDELNSTLVGLRDTLNETTVTRKEEHEDNVASMEKAQEGLKAIRKAILILKVFYKKAAKASLLQASPADDLGESGFDGAYRGKQDASKGVMALLETIETNFRQSLEATKVAEETAHRDFVKFEQSQKSDIQGKETSEELKTDDLKATKDGIVKKTEELETTQGLLDDAVKEIEDLRPACMDNGMSYEDRVAKREEEIAALRRAMCYLNPAKKDGECK